MKSYRFQWKTACYPAPAIFAGLLMAQLIATFQVYFSNRSLYHTFTNIGEAGYFMVPHQKAMGNLLELTAALCGGLFLTMSMGAGICLLSFTAAWVWDRIFFRKTGFLFLGFLIWAGLAGGINWSGFSPFGSLYVLAIPPVVVAGVLKWIPNGDGKNLRRTGLLQTIPIIVLGLLWAPQMKNDLFHQIRDHLLRTNPLGEKIVDFYYCYTLYAAEAIRSLDQKLLKTYRMDSSGNEIQFKGELKKILSDNNWIETKKLQSVDLVLSFSVNEILLKDLTDTILKVPKSEFLSHPAAALKQFSSLTDRNRFFRQLTFYSLLIGFPITLYIFLYSFFFYLVGRWLPPGRGAFLSATLCFCTALVCLITLWLNNAKIF